MIINKNGNWKLYWGQMPLPQNSKTLGTVTLDHMDSGALILMPTGIYVHGSYGVIKSLDQNDVVKLLEETK